MHCTCSSPIGPLQLVGDEHALTALWLPGRHRAHDGPEDRGPFAAAIEQLDAFFAGARRAFDLPLAAAGTPFQHRVWDALRQIPYGETTTYGALAAGLGVPNAARAVGRANGLNPISVVVPCHRVVGASGKLTGYAGGLERKAQLLALERAGARATV